ncbi:NACHT domain-containing protein [Streptomyces sp. NPDC029004]|uniref:NACHT domain-containing protein n=1 Tax=Streptomyces sp. NPDC029004 TaxID=3154490 RepID=UPI0034033278
MHRIAAVFGAQQGSGYLLTPRLVLTAGHLLREGSETVVIVPGGLGRVTCHAIWVGVGEHRDAALLVADTPLVAPKSCGASELGLGKIDGLAPVMDCYAIGFPRVQRYDGERLDIEQFVGTIKPGSQSIRGDYVIDSVYTSPSALKGGGSPWAGMSGAPLLSGRYLIGVVIVDAAGWQHSRLTAVPIHRLLSDPDFSNIYRQHVGSVRFHRLRHTPDGPAEFEQRYRTYIGDVHGELNIFGLDFSVPENAQWPLDSAYISLELVRREGEGYEPDYRDIGYGDRGPHAEERARVEFALYDRRRVLLRGLAGSGKTTLMQWLAVNAARDSFGDQLAHLHGRVPFMLPMRTLVRGASLPAVGDLISAAGHPLTPPEGWVDAVLTEGRGLLLVDGVDEMPQEDRTRTREWLFKLLAAYPDNVVVVTTRPTAVDDGWLNRKGFTEFQLLPMNQQDITEFVRRWYKAASSITVSTAKRTQLDTYRDQLLDTLPRKRDLARLATNPLMCAMICALHRDRRGFLPASRMKLYEAALTMLLVRRDQERDLAAPEGLEVSEEAQQKLLQEIAYWMIRNGLAEAEQQQVIDLIGRLLPAMPQVGTPDQAPDVFRVLLHRSGLLRVPAPQTVAFVHRTFLDYLGARAAVDAQDINLVANHAHEPQWEDTVRMAVGHARDKERATLLERLVEMGDSAADSSRDLRVRLHLLAAASLEHATSLDPQIRAEVEQRAAALVPPKDAWEATQLAEAGPIVLDLLPGPAGLTDEEAAAVVTVAVTIRGDHALKLLHDYRDHPALTVREALVRSWSSFDAATYAENVLAPMRTDDVWITVSTAEELVALPSIGGAHNVVFSHALSPDGIAAAAHAVVARNMVVSDNPRLRNLIALSEVNSSLTTLVLDSCERFVDYNEVAKLGLESLDLTLMPASATLSALSSATTLRRATLDLHGDLRLPTLPLPPGLVHLSLSGNCALLDSLNGVELCHDLESLRIDTDPFVIPEKLRRLESLPELRELTCSLRSFTALTGDDLPILTTVTKLNLQASVDTDSSAADLRRLFPMLRELCLDLKCRHPVTLDVTALAGIPATTIRVVEGPMNLRGAELLPVPPEFSEEVGT